MESVKGNKKIETKWKVKWFGSGYENKKKTKQRWTKRIVKTESDRGEGDEIGEVKIKEK